MIENINIDMFKKEEIMKIYYNDGILEELEIYKVKKSELANFFDAPKIPFSLILKGSKSIFFNQGYYDFEHENMSKVELYMVPIIAAKGDFESYYYEISFL